MSGLSGGKTRLVSLLRMLGRAFLIACAIVFTGSYIVLSPRVSGTLFSHVLFFPHPPNELYAMKGVAGAEKEDVRFPAADGSNLHGWLFRNPSDRSLTQGKTVLICHGNAGNMSHRLPLVALLIDAGASVFIFDYRGFGLSEGKPTLAGVCADGQAAYRYLSGQLHVPPSRIIIFGESIGGGVATAVAVREPPAAVILTDTFTSLLHVAGTKVPVMRLYPRWLASDPPLDNLAYARGLHPPLLIVHGEEDTIIPVEEGRALFASAAEPKRLLLLPHSGHNDKSLDAEVYALELKDFIRSLP